MFRSWCENMKNSHFRAYKIIHFTEVTTNLIETEYFYGIKAIIKFYIKFEVIATLWFSIRINTLISV